VAALCSDSLHPERDVWYGVQKGMPCGPSGDTRLAERENRVWHLVHFRVLRVKFGCCLNRLRPMRLILRSVMVFKDRFHHVPVLRRQGFMAMMSLHTWERQGRAVR